MDANGCKMLATTFIKMKKLTISDWSLTQPIVKLEVKPSKNSFKLSCQIWKAFIYVVLILFRMELNR